MKCKELQAGAGQGGERVAGRSYSQGEAAEGTVHGLAARGIRGRRQAETAQGCPEHLQPRQRHTPTARVLRHQLHAPGKWAGGGGRNGTGSENCGESLLCFCLYKTQNLRHLLLKQSSEVFPYALPCSKSFSFIT